MCGRCGIAGRAATGAFAMARDFIPRRDGDFAAFAAAFASQVSADPEIYGQTPESAGKLASAEASFAQAFRDASAESTRTRSAVARKDTARRVIEDMIRRAAWRARVSPTLSAAQRLALGLGAPGYCSRPSDLPDDPPAITILQAVGNRVKVRVSDPAAPSRVARPRGASHALLLWCEGERPLPPGSPGWKFRQTGRTTAEVVFPVGLPPGAAVWISARWIGYNHKLGPQAPAVRAYLTPTGGTLVPPTLRRAA
jgi:hypothetical protein